MGKLGWKMIEMNTFVKVQNNEDVLHGVKFVFAFLPFSAFCQLPRKCKQHVSMHLFKLSLKYWGCVIFEYFSLYLNNTQYSGKGTIGSRNPKCIRVGRLYQRLETARKCLPSLSQINKCKDFGRNKDLSNELITSDCARSTWLLEKSGFHFFFVEMLNLFSLLKYGIILPEELGGFAVVQFYEGSFPLTYPMCCLTSGLRPIQKNPTSMQTQQILHQFLPDLFSIRLVQWRMKFCWLINF